MLQSSIHLFQIRNRLVLLLRYDRYCKMRCLPEHLQEVT